MFSYQNNFLRTTLFNHSSVKIQTQTLNCRIKVYYYYYYIDFLFCFYSKIILLSLAHVIRLAFCFYSLS